MDQLNLDFSLALAWEHSLRTLGLSPSQFSLLVFTLEISLEGDWLQYSFESLQHIFELPVSFLLPLTILHLQYLRQDHQVSGFHQRF